MELTEQDVVTGSQIGIILANETESSGSTTVTRTLLAEAAKSDLSATIEDSEEDFTPAARYATQRYIVSGTIDLEVSSAVAPSLDQLKLLSIADSDGKLNRSPGDRKIGATESAGTNYLEWAFFDGEPDYSSVDVTTDSEILMRFGDVQIANPEFDPSGAPLMVSFEGWVNGEFWLNYSPSST